MATSKDAGTSKDNSSAKDTKSSSLNTAFKLVATVLYFISAVLALYVTAQAIFSPESMGNIVADNLTIIMTALWGHVTIVTVGGQVFYGGPGTDAGEETQNEEKAKGKSAEKATEN